MTGDQGGARPSEDVVAEAHAVAAGTRAAWNQWRGVGFDGRTAALRAIAEELTHGEAEILAANDRDVVAAQAAGMEPSLVDRLRLDAGRLGQMRQGLVELASLPDPLGEVVEGRTLANGIRLRCERVPLGVIGMIYEARPNVTIEAAGIALKCGNGMVLRGGGAALHSNAALVALMHRALESCGVPTAVVGLIASPDRRSAQALMAADQWVDVLIPRGGKALIAAVKRESTVPVIETGSGNVHVYVDATADLIKATGIVLNAKTQRPSVCNAAETLLVHEGLAEGWLPTILRELHSHAVVLHGDVRACAAAAVAGVPMGVATEELFDTEFHGLEMTVGVVSGVEEALAHVARYSTGHTEVVVTENVSVAQQWRDQVDAAVVGINVSSRFTDGGQFGLGAEIGISTQKLHARGPMGLRAMTSTRWLMEGEGQVRE